MQFSISRLIQFYLYSPALYASVSWRPYGLLFRDPKNDGCHDANHGAILDLSCNLSAALADLERFYRARCIVPRVYGGFVPGEEALFPVLKERGYHIEFFENEKHLLLENVPFGLSHLAEARTEHPRALTMELSALLTQHLGPWAVGMEEQLLFRPDCRAYLLRSPAGEAAAYGLVIRTDQCACVQNVFTVPSLRRQGYCAALLSHVIHDHRKDCPGLPLYLSTVSPDALRLYEGAGFRQVCYPHPMWTAALEPQN